MTNKKVGITILVVDDEKNVRKAVAAEFEDEGYTVITAQHGQEALEILASSLVAVVISDIVMPVLNGIELLRRIKSGPTSIPVVLITGVSNLADFEPDCRLADAILAKPLDGPQLIAIVQRLFSVA